MLHEAEAKTYEAEAEAEAEATKFGTGLKDLTSLATCPTAHYSRYGTRL